MHSSIFSYLRKKKVEVIVPSSLPDDVIEEIFIRLPVKELIRLKFSLPQEWRLRIESHGFGPRFHIYNPKLHPMFTYLANGGRTWIYLSTIFTTPLASIGAAGSRSRSLSLPA
ncbi:F-box/kelch-repeat protein [Arabidopsis thaliana]|uniref:F-box/kelch-repeat protein n=1 Tax=Arabidopsis thaliana TaxID=3702 RepID=A0A1P8AS56_ARATH|nr:F-box/kelch-repeat protein [Arabidopsis thaliana]ANM59491.1 F-box/kelch-repeat protein [Arabidopsis thaliana]|eukprot:NP_001321846.1 F-box/kelch-repeat protein [Arabidopsis thaliana]